MSAFSATAPQRLSNFDRRPWRASRKVRGYNAKYDCFPCQVTFSTAPNGMRNDIEFRVLKPDNGGYWQNRLEEVRMRGPAGQGLVHRGRKMYGLEFREQWYIVGADSFVLVACKGDTQQGPYEGAFLYTRNKDDYDTNPDCVRATRPRKAGLELSLRHRQRLPHFRRHASRRLQR